MILKEKEWNNKDIIKPFRKKGEKITFSSAATFKISIEIEVFWIICAVRFNTSSIPNKRYLKI